MEQATLRNELKKYKRSLLEAERNVARMAEELKATKSSAEAEGSFVCPLEHGMSEDEAAQLKAAQDEAEEQKNEAMFIRKELEDLKRELWETKREKQVLESGADAERLEAQIEDWKGRVEDANMEIANLKEQIDMKDEELVYSFLGYTDFRMCCRINWLMRRKRWKNWKVEDPMPPTMTTWPSNCKPTI